MKTIIAAIFALSATTGLALAQGEGQAPQLIGDLSANVDERYNDNTNINTGDGIFSATTRAARDRSERIGLERKFPERYTGR